MTRGNSETQGSRLYIAPDQACPVSLFMKRTRLSCDVAELAAFPVVGAGGQFPWGLCSGALSLTGPSALQWGSQQPRQKGLGLRGRKLSPRALAVQSLSSANAEDRCAGFREAPGSLRTEVSRGQDSSPAPALVPGFLETRVRTEKQHWIREHAFVSWVFFGFFYWSCFY